MNTQEIINAIALSRLHHFNSAAIRSVYNHFGSATAVIQARNHIQEALPNASPRLIQSLQNMSEVLERAKIEMAYNEENGISALLPSHPDYPQRLNECDDAPLVLFCKGRLDLNCRRIVSIVGTRHATVYGQDLVQRFIADLHQYCPDLLIVSGLAYGIDIMAHRAALQNKVATAAVLAHGLDYLYPTRHRDTATKMCDNGGLITEFLTNTNADKVNFVRRNRIVAGLSDAVVVVESAEKGGSLITADIAQSYNREVFAFPGNVGAQYSSGCNALIRDQKAQLITSAYDMIKALGWDEDLQRTQALKQGVERELFPELTTDEQLVVNCLQRTNDQQINILAVNTNLPVNKLVSLLFSLEMKGLIRMLPGGVYHLIQNN